MTHYAPIHQNGVRMLFGVLGDFPNKVIENEKQKSRIKVISGPRCTACWNEIELIYKKVNLIFPEGRTSIFISKI